MYLLDTNACLDYLLARSAAVRDRLRAEGGKVVVSSISAAELSVGNKTSLRPAEDAAFLRHFLTSVRVEAFGEDAALAYGKIAQVNGILRHSFDRLIAAHAIALGVTLVTADVRGFGGIPGLTIENWRS